MADLSQFNFEQAEDWGSNLLPAGEYHVRITDDSVKETSRGTNYINMRYDVLDGDRRGKVVFDGLFLWSDSQTAVNIAMSKLKSIAKATGHPSPQLLRNTNELLGKEMIVKVSIRKHKDTGDEFQSFDAYKPCTTAQTVQTVQNPQPAQTPSAPQAPSFPTAQRGDPNATPWG